MKAQIQENQTDMDEEAQDRLRARHLKMTYEKFLTRRDKLRKQAKELIESN